MQAQAKATPQQLRGFVAVWIGLTLLIGIATFVAIYIGTGSLDGENTANALSGSALNTSRNVNNPIGDDSNEAVVAVAPNNNSAVLDSASINNDANKTDNALSGDEGSGSNTNNIESNNDVALAAQETEEPADAPPAQDPTQTPTPELQPTVPAVEQQDFDLGVQIGIPDPFNENDMKGWLDAAANQLNLNWLKVQIRWEFIEPEEGVYDWNRLDAFFALTGDYNIKVLASIVTAPAWAREPGADLSKHGPPADNQKFANFIAQILTRYPSKIHAIEVWNEMNIDREWASIQGISAPNYVSMVKTVADTVRFIDPNIMIVSGALSPTGWDDETARPDFAYTDQLIAAGVLNIVDCFGAHHNGYNIGPSVPFDNVPPDPTALFRGPFDNAHPSWSFYTTLTTYANKIQAAGSDVPLCVTEFGWAVTADMSGVPAGFEFAQDNTIEEQGQYLVEAINLMQEWGFVRLALIWNLNFGPAEGFNAASDNVPYSLIRPNYIPSPAWLPISEMNFRSKQIQ